MRYEIFNATQYCNIVIVVGPTAKLFVAASEGIGGKIEKRPQQNRILRLVRPYDNNMSSMIFQQTRTHRNDIVILLLYNISPIYYIIIIHDRSYTMLLCTWCHGGVDGIICVGVCWQACRLGAVHWSPRFYFKMF